MTSTTSDSPRPLARLALALGLGVACALYADLFWSHPRQQPSDFAQLWHAGHALLNGESPYDAIGPGRSFSYVFPLFYPLPAVIASLPFAAVPLRLADALFVGFGAALLGWALTKRSLANPQLLVFASLAMTTAAQTVQWSPWLTAAALMPSLGFLFACKPSIGLAMLTAYPSRRACVGAAAFALLSLMVMPSWVAEWIDALPAATHMSAPVTRFGGPLLLLALLRWRRPEARLLAVLAFVPQTPVLYEAVPLFLLVRTLREGVMLTAATTVLGPIMSTMPVGVDYHAWMAVNGQWMVALVYLPCLLMVLRRPNQGDENDWIVRTVRVVRRSERPERSERSERTRIRIRIGVRPASSDCQSST